MIAILLALALSAPSGLPPSVHPWPIGVGAGFRIAAAPPAVLAGRPVGRFRCGRSDGPRVGVARPWRGHLAQLTPGGCTYPARTLEPTGVIEVSPGAGLTLGDVFQLWGQPLGPRRLAGFRGRVLAFVGGRRRHGDPRTILLTWHAQIVLEIGGYVPPHSRYLFVRGL